MGQDDDLVAGLGVRRSPQGRQQVVRIGAVRDRRRLLLERRPPFAGWRDRRDRLAEVAARADLGGDRGHEPLLRDDVPQVLLEPRRAVDVADDGGDLDLVHREDHRARATAAAQLEAGRGDRLERDAAAA